MDPAEVTAEVVAARTGFFFLPGGGGGGTALKPETDSARGPARGGGGKERGAALTCASPLPSFVGGNGAGAASADAAAAAPALPSTRAMGARMGAAVDSEKSVKGCRRNPNSTKLDSRP